MNLLGRKLHLNDALLMFLLFFSLTIVGVCWVFESTLILVQTSVLVFLLGVVSTKRIAIHGYYSLSIVAVLALMVYSLAIPVHHLSFNVFWSNETGHFNER